MPYIPTLKEKRKLWVAKHSLQIRQERRKIPLSEDAKTRQRMYNSNEWRSLSDYIRKTRPLCELCLLENKIKEAEEVHHLIRWNSQQPLYKNLLLLDEDNIVCLCKLHHSFIHGKLSELTDKQRQFILLKKQEVYDKYLLNYMVIELTDDNTHSHGNNDEH